MYGCPTLNRQSGPGGRWGAPAKPRYQFLLYHGESRSQADSAAPRLDPRRTRLMQAFWQHTRDLFLDEARAGATREVARSFLRVWGFPPERLDQLPLGLFGQMRAMKAAMGQAGFSEAEVKTAKALADQRLPGRLVGAIRDRQGRIQSFWARSLDDRGPKYLFHSGQWKQSVGAVGIEVALASGSDGHMVLVEDPIDALLLQSHGMTQVAAVGSSGKDLTEPRWERLAALGAGSVTLALGDDEPGHEGLAFALASALRAQGAPEVWFLPVGSLGGAATAGQFVRTAGTEAFRRLVYGQRVHSYRHQAAVILEAHRSGLRWTPSAHRAALEAAITFYVAHNGGDSRRLDTHFVPPIIEGLGLDHDAPAAPAASPPEPGKGYCTMHRCAVTRCFCFD